MAQQTAVEWLEDKIKDNIFCDHICGIEYWDKETLLGFIEQAKQMEREQHGKTWDEAIKANENRGNVIARSICDFDDYYTETYGNNQNK